jgi:hypothetical protein
MKAEKLLLAAGFRLDIISTPKEISSACGLSIRMKPENTDLEMVRLVLTENGLTFNIHEKK